MGNSTFRSTDWTGYAAKTSKMRMDDIYTSKTINTYLDPKNISIRESRDSDANPQSTPVCLFTDVTGSMGILADTIAKKGLGITMQGIIDRKAVSDPHVLIGGIGDIRFDSAPLQATQFEAGVPEITSQIEKLWIEKRGGNNNTESYDLAWWFAATRTVSDSWEKRQKKGYLFTMGDEEPPVSLPANHMRAKLGADVQSDLMSVDLLEMAERQWNVFHIVVEGGSYCRTRGADRVASNWADLIGQRVIRLSDVDKLGEVIVSAIQVIEGADKDTVAASWSGGTDVVVAHAVKDLQIASTGMNGRGVVRF